MSSPVMTPTHPRRKTSALRYAILDRLDELREDVLVVEHHLEMRGVSAENRQALNKLHRLLKHTIYKLEARL